MDPCVPTITNDGRINCDIRQLNTGFVNALEDVYDVIRRKYTKVPNVYRDRIPRGEYMLGHGLERSIITHHAGMGDMAGLEKWEEIKMSDPDADFDACKYQAHVVDSGFSRVSYTGHRTARRSKNICLNDIKWIWEYEQQVSAYFDWLSDVTARIWETWGRENYMIFCTSYILSEGGADAVETSYNPLESPDTTIPNVKISTLKWDYLTWYHQMLSLGCPDAALAYDGGLPIFGLVMHPLDWHDMIETDEKLRETYNYAAPTTLLEHYGSAPTFKGYMIIGDMEAPRWRIDGQAANGDLQLTRIVPYIPKKTTKGVKYVPNPDYVNAEIAYGVIFLNDVYTTLVPPAGPANVGGASFGVVPGLMGDFKWLNIQDLEKNMLNENGFYFARYEAFSEPGENHTEPIGFFYRRCVNIKAGECESDEVGSATAVTVAGLFATQSLASAVDVGEKIAIDGSDYEVLSGELGITVANDLDVVPTGDVTFDTGDRAVVKLVSEDGKTIVLTTDLAGADVSSVRPEGPNQLRVTLAAALACGVGSEVTVATNGAGDVAGVLSATEDQPTYVISFAEGSTPTAAQMLVGTATVICG